MVFDDPELLQALATLSPPNVLVVEVVITDGDVAHLQLGPSSATFHSGPAEAPSFIVEATGADWIDLAEGYASIEAALIDGRLAIAGDLGLATRWAPKIFEAIRSSGSRRGPASSGPGR